MRPWSFRTPRVAEAGDIPPEIRCALERAGVAVKPLAECETAAMVLVGTTASPPQTVRGLRGALPHALLVGCAPAGPPWTDLLREGVLDDLLPEKMEPAWMQARLSVLLEAAAGRDGAGEDGSFRALVEAQEALIACQNPLDILEHARTTLERWFPGAEVAVHEADEAEPATEEGAPAAPWGRASVPLVASGRVLGRFEVAAPPGAGYEPVRFRLLKAFAAQTAQALHRSRLYRALSIGKAEWEQTFDAIPDTIVLLDRAYRIRRANRALAELKGLHPRELVGRRCYEALYGRQSPCVPCPVTRVLETGREAREEPETRRGGRVFTFRAYPLEVTDGEVVTVIAYARDVTRERELARRLERNEKLMSLGQIAAGIAHEINNPLTAVSSYAQLLSLRLKDPRAVESAKRIEEGIQRIHRLVRNLMSFVRPESESLYPLDLNEVVRDTLSFSRYDVTRGQVELVEDLAPALPRVLGAKEQLEQVLLNLLSNARDAVAGRGTIVVRTWADDGCVHLEVQDDGVGIPPEHRDKIFEPFFTTKPPGKGTGLGLFVAAGIARRHNGDLQVESLPGRGTRARLSLPVFPPEPGAAAAGPPTDPDEGA